MNWRDYVNPRVVCEDGVSLSVQANSFAYCKPRVNSHQPWRSYEQVEVGFISDKNGHPFTPPDSWRTFGEIKFPSDIYAFIPTSMVEDFIDSHGGEMHEMRNKRPQVAVTTMQTMDTLARQRQNAKR